MSLPRYCEYRSVEHDWLKHIPQNWSLEPLKRHVRIATGATPSSSSPEFWDGDIAWATPVDLTASKGTRLRSTARTLTTAGMQSCATELVPEGSVLLSTRAPIGTVAIAGVATCINQGCRALVPKGSVGSDYLARTLEAWSDHLGSLGKGSTFLELSTDALGAVAVPIPPLTEQARIGVFLDRETTKIDALIAEQQRLIALLQEKRQAVISHAVTKGLDPNVPMKDSGLEWIGQTPSHWTLPPVADRYRVELGKMLDEKRIDGAHLLPYLRNVNVQWDTIDTSELPEMDIEPGEYDRYLVQAGDLLVCEGGEVGRAAIWDGRFAPCAYQKALHRLRPRRSNEVPRFMLYTLRHAVALGVFTANGNQNTIPHLTAQQLRRYRFPTPPEVEQRAIVEHLDHRTRELDAATSDAECAVALLRERRTALITAAVTGQIDVRGLVEAAA